MEKTDQSVGKKHPAERSQHDKVIRPPPTISSPSCSWRRALFNRASLFASVASTMRCHPIGWIRFGANGVCRFSIIHFRFWGQMKPLSGGDPKPASTDLEIHVDKALCLRFFPTPPNPGESRKDGSHPLLNREPGNRFVDALDRRT